MNYNNGAMANNKKNLNLHIDALTSYKTMIYNNTMRWQFCWFWHFPKIVQLVIYDGYMTCNYSRIQNGCPSSHGKIHEFLYVDCEWVPKHHHHHQFIIEIVRIYFTALLYATYASALFWIWLGRCIVEQCVMY